MGWKEPVFNREQLVYLMIVSIVIIAIFMLFIPYKTIKSFEFPAKIEIKEDFMNVENKQTDILDFGIVSSGLRVKKFIELDIGKAQPAIVYVGSSGEIKQFIDIEEDKFVITEPKKLEITAIIPKGIDEGVYTGVIKVEYKMTIARKLKNIFS